MTIEMAGRCIVYMLKDIYHDDYDGDDDWILCYKDLPADIYASIPDQTI